MGRFTSNNTDIEPGKTNNNVHQTIEQGSEKGDYFTNPFNSSNPYASQCNSPFSDKQPSQEQMEIMEAQSTWPQEFPKPVVGCELRGVITDENFNILPGALEAVRMIRLKGHKFMLIQDESGRSQDDVMSENMQLMDIFGKAKIFSIDGMYFSNGIAALKDPLTGGKNKDPYIKPGTAMFKRAQKEHPHIIWKQGSYVGPKISDCKAAFKIGATPVLISNDESVIQKSNSYSNRPLKKKTIVFNSLLDYARSL